MILKTLNPDAMAANLLQVTGDTGSQETFPRFKTTVTVAEVTELIFKNAKGSTVTVAVSPAANTVAAASKAIQDALVANGYVFGKEGDKFGLTVEASGTDLVIEMKGEAEFTSISGVAVTKVTL